MSWAKIDDKLFAHPKFIGVSLEASGLWLRALSYAAYLERDGWFPTAAISVFAPHTETEPFVHELVHAALWVRVADGYTIHDYLKYNPSRKRLNRERKKTATRVQAFRARNTVTNAVTTPVVTRLPSRPVPSRSRPKEDLFARSARSHRVSEGFESAWTAYGHKEGRQDALREWTRLAPDLALRETIHTAIARYQQTDRWQRGIRLHFSTYLHQRRWEDEPETLATGAERAHELLAILKGHQP